MDNNIKKKSKRGSKKSKGSLKSKKISTKSNIKQHGGNNNNPVISKSPNEDNKCAPSKRFDEGSCFTLESLIDMSHAFNTYIELGLLSKQRIKICNSKKDLVLQLTDRLKNICDDQLCWLKQDFMRLTKNQDDIQNKTFRPSGPQGRFTWLSTSNINKVMGQYEEKYPEFKYLGTVPMDFNDLPVLGLCNINFNNLYNTGKYKLGIVFNLDEHYKSGSHWVAMFANLKTFEIYYFDSYGKQPENRVRDFVSKISHWCLQKHFNKVIEPSDHYMKPSSKNNIETLDGVKILYNKNRHQYKNSECGVYSMNFILRLLKGENFEQITSIRLSDDDVNKCREVYFRYDNNDNDKEDDDN
jgi:hypothetical protein